jgi:hypothetical protein
MKLTIDIRDDDMGAIASVIERANQSEANSHGPLDVEALAQMLLEDVALVARRPGPWEGKNMRVVLTAHGYEV